MYPKNGYIAMYAIFAYMDSQGIYYLLPTKLLGRRRESCGATSKSLLSLGFKVKHAAAKSPLRVTGRRVWTCPKMGRPLKSVFAFRVALKATKQTTLNADRPSPTSSSTKKHNPQARLLRKQALLSQEVVGLRGRLGSGATHALNHQETHTQLA